MFLLAKTSKLFFYKKICTLVSFEPIWPQMHARSTLPHFLSILVLSLNFQNFNNHKISKCVEVSAVNWDWLSKLWAFWSPKDLRAFCSLHLHRGVSKKTWLSHVHKKSIMSYFYFLKYTKHLFVWIIFQKTPKVYETKDPKSINFEWT